MLLYLHMAKIDEILSAFSLSDVETKIYLSALGMEKPAVAQLAKQAGLNRTAAYHHIKHLLEKGFLRQTRKGRIVQLVAVPPAELADRFDHLTTDFKGLIPQLESLQKISRETPIIEITESRRGYYQIYDEISALPPGSTFRVMEGLQALKKELRILTDKEWNIFFSRIVDRKLVTRAVFTEESLAVPGQALSPANVKLISQRIWQLKSLPVVSLPFSQLMFIYGEKVAFLFPESSLVMAIKHKGIAEVMTALFEGLFGFAKPVNQPWANLH